MKRLGIDWHGVDQLCRRVLDRLDWQALGEIYFHWGGEEFWEDKLPQVTTLGELLAKRLLSELPRGGSSLWVGAGVAELPVLLPEVLLHDRVVVAAKGLFARLARPGLVTTSAEEVAWFLEQAEAVGATIDASEDLVETAVVGDPVGFLTVR